MSNYDILFEPVPIGPVIARNRFYQVPHCNGMGHVYPAGVAWMRGVKAEGGWAVVCTEECEIHPSTDVSPYPEARLWDDNDMRSQALTAEKIKQHGSLAGIEITHNGHAAGNSHSRLPVMGVSDLPRQSYDPAQCYAMGKRDIANLRRWHRKAAIRSKQAGFDIVYVYAGHNLSLPFHFLSRRLNQRNDEYGGSLENRVRLLRELIEDTKDAVGDSCAIAVRLAVDELLGDEGISAEGEGHDIIAMLAELPDLWDVNVSDWENDSVTARFGEQGAQEPYIRFVKQLTTKPVVGVGRFTSADEMVAQIKRGVLDFIGAARPSIADPFLPNKIQQGRIEDIRECIGCNICVSGDWTQSPIRCTQNPTVAEEFRRGWHPERIAPAGDTSSRVLVIGAGPSGLEAALASANRGYQVTLAERTTELGGRVAREARLPGLASWARVRDYRVHQLQKMANVEIYLDSGLTVADIAEFNACHVICATGSEWVGSGIGRQHHAPLAIADGAVALTPDDLMAGRIPAGHCLIYDDDHYYMGGVLAEFLVDQGCRVTLVTPAALVSEWSINTMEQHRIEQRLVEKGVVLMTRHQVLEIGSESVRLENLLDGQQRSVDVSASVLVTMRRPVNALYENLLDAGFDEEILHRIGDCHAPSTIAAAVYAGHLCARQLDEKIDVDAVPFRRELVALPSAM